MPDTVSPRRRRQQDSQEKPQEAPQANEKPKPDPVPGRPIGVLQRRLETFFVSMALPFAAAGDMHCASVFVERGPVVAEAWANLAAESPAVKRVLENMLKGGAWAGAISSTVALVIPIAAHHGAPIPDIVTATILGRRPETSNGHVDEPMTQTQEQNQNGHRPEDERPAHTRPAAVSVSGSGINTGPDPRDPQNYPGPHNGTTD